ncbi:DUF2511 domain-containing protein [Halomonas sp. KM072]
MKFGRGGEDKIMALAIVGIVAFGIVSMTLSESGGAANDAASEEAQPSLDAAPATDDTAQDQEVTNETRGVLVTREEYGDDWPFTVDSGRLDCRQGGAAVFTSGQWTYQLNGVASQKGYADLAPIWRDNPAIPGAKVSISDMISVARQQCAQDPAFEAARIQAQRDRESQDRLAVVQAQRLVRESLRDGRSSDFRNIYVSQRSGRNVCGEVSARNALGGMSGYQRFIISGRSVIFEEVSPNFAGLWQQSC